MDIFILAVGLLFLIILIWLAWKNRDTAKMLHHATDELKFFKKEKEYYGEAMLLLTKDYTVFYANQSAKTLFSLDEHNKTYSMPKKVQLQVVSGVREDFFTLLSTHSDKSFKLDNVFLFVEGQEHKVNIFMDKSALNVNGTMTCIVDMKPTGLQVDTKEQMPDGTVDFLTSLPSQFKALSNINTLVVESRKKSEKFALFLLGIDHFSDMQATLGLGYANKTLKHIAQHLVESLDETVDVYRMECDKFLLVVKKQMDDTEMRKRAKRIISDLQSSIGSSIRTTISAGIVYYPAHGENASKLINHAYVALQDAQQESDSNIALFETACQTLGKNDLDIHEEIHSGLKNHEFFLHYQPIFSLKAEEMVGAEALLRWNHPRLGVVNADKFLKVAERTGLIVDIGEYVFKEAIKQRRAWAESGLRKIKITLNLSLKEMHVEKLVQKLEILFSDNAVNPRDFSLDISESTAMENMEKTAMDLKYFKDLGLSLNLDHFGAGVSSLKHLQALPLSMVKIDRSLIFDIYSNHNHQITVKSMIELIHGLGFEAVGEGVETSNELALLQEYGCDYVQGYLFSKPLPAKELEALLR